MIDTVAPHLRFSPASAADERHRAPGGPRSAAAAAQQHGEKPEKTAAAQQQSKGGKRELTDDEREQVEELKRIDRHVRQHEAAHQAAAGGLARGKSFTYKQGPDNKQYAVAGEVQIDTSAVPGDPQATIAKMQRVRAAATAPSDPSAQDRAVAAQAARTEAEARAELLKPEEEQQSAAAGATPDTGERTTDGSAAGTPRHTGTQSATFSPFTSSYEHRGAFINTYA